MLASTRQNRVSIWCFVLCSGSALGPWFAVRDPRRVATPFRLSFAPFATDDSHYPAFGVNDAWTMVRAADRTREAVVTALREGHVYASNGPEILDMERDGETVEVACTPARDLWLHSGWEDGLGLSVGPRGRRDGGEILERDGRGLITRARFNPSPDAWPKKRDHRWWRLVIADEAGRRAWSNVI